MPRSHHKDKDLEQILKEAERKDWTVTGGGNRYFKMKCPNACKCMKMVHCTPSGANYKRNLVAQLARATCWEE